MTKIDLLIANLISGEDSIAEAAVKEIGQFGSVAIEDLANLLDQENSDIRWWAIRSLAELKVIGATQLIIKHLDDDDIAVQQCAAIALRINPSEYAIKKLALLLEHEDNLLSQLASDALIELGKIATLSLIEVVEKGSQKAQIQAIRALAKIGDTESISTLFTLLGSDSAMLHYWAEEGLNKMGIGMTFFNPT